MDPLKYVVSKFELWFTELFLTIQACSEALQRQYFLNPNLQADDEHWWQNALLKVVVAAAHTAVVGFVVCSAVLPT